MKLGKLFFFVFTLLLPTLVLAVFNIPEADLEKIKTAIAESFDLGTNEDEIRRLIPLMPGVEYDFKPESKEWGNFLKRSGKWFFVPDIKDAQHKYAIDRTPLAKFLPLKPVGFSGENVYRVWKLEAKFEGGKRIDIQDLVTIARLVPDGSTIKWTKPSLGKTVSSSELANEFPLATSSR